MTAATRWVIGAYYDDDKGGNSGSVYCARHGQQPRLRLDAQFTKLTARPPALR